MEEIAFKPWPKIPRWSRDIVITEKIDGTNASIYIDEQGRFLAGSRTRWLTLESDNFGFCKWAHDNKDELMKLGVGTHFGEWWGVGIQRGYGLSERRFSLFNTSKWMNDSVRPKCCDVVPVLYRGAMDFNTVDTVLEFLRENGSVAAHGAKPEGIVIFHTASNHLYKKTIENDEQGKEQCKQSHLGFSGASSISSL